MAKSPAWQRSEGKNPEGGLNAKGRAAYNRANPGKPGLKRPQPEGGARRDSFCARMKGMKRKLTSAKTANDPDSRINKSLRAWNCAEGGVIKKYAKGGGISTEMGKGIPTPRKNAPPLSAFTGRKPRALDTPTEIKVPKPRVTDEDLVSPRVKRNRKIAEAIFASVPMGRGPLIRMGRWAIAGKAGLVGSDDLLDEPFYAKGGGISTEMDKGKPTDLRMAQMDKYLKDPDLELVRGPNGKFQFRERKTSTPVVPARRPKTSDANNVPGARSGDKTPRGGGIPTPRKNAPPLSAFTGRKPRALDTPTEIKVPKPRIKDEDLVSPRVKRNRKIAEAALASVPVGRGALAGLKAARAEFFPANQLTQRAMSRTISRARPGEVVPPSDSLFPRFKSDTASARALRETRGFSEEARQALKRGDITRGEARTMTEGYRGGGKIKSGKVATVMREFKKGELHSGKSNKPVKNPRQAVAIALSEGRKAARRK